MGLFNKFPYTDLNSINLDYTLNKLNDLYERGEALYTQLQTWQAETTEDLASWKSDVEAGLAEWKTATEGSLDTKFQQLTTAINTAFSDLETQLEAHIAEIETTAVNAASAAATSAEGAALSEDAAAASATAAAGSASDAADTAESLSESLDQIATNTSDITDLKSAISISATTVVDVTTGDYRPVMIGSNNKWASGNNRHCYIYQRPYGSREITVTASATTGATIAFLTTNNTRSGELVDYCTNTSKITITAGNTANYTIPADCLYIYIFNDYDGTSYMPASVSIYFVKYTDDTLTMLGKPADAKITGDKIANNIADITQLKVDLFPAESELPLNVIHRGLATNGYPENTIVAYKDAIAKGWKYLETDIRQTSDGVWVLLHDSDINRVARNANGSSISETIYISNITYDEALTYDFGIAAEAQFAGTKIATLDAFLNLCSKAHVYPVIEIKDSTITEAQAATVWDIVKKYQMQNRCMWLCSSYGGVKWFLALNPYAPCIHTSSTTWQYIDISTLTPSSEKPYAYTYYTGKNRVYHAHSVSGISSKALMDNMIDYYHHFGIYAGVYSPTTQAGIEACSDRLDYATTQYLKYSDVKVDEIE